MDNLAKYSDPVLLKKLIESNDLEDGELLKSIVVEIIDKDRGNHLTQLLDSGYTIKVFNEKKQTPLHYAFYSKRQRMTEIIIESESLQNDCYDYTDSNGLRHLHVVCTHYHEGVFNMIKAYLNNGSDINASFHHDPKEHYSQCTPLHFAIAHNQYSIAQFLLENGANINAVDSKGKTPLHLACQMNYPKDISQFIQLLVNNFHANIEARDEHGDTPLLSMFDYRETDPVLASNFCIKYTKSKLDILLKHGANIMAKNNKGDTVLHLAIKTLRHQRCHMYLPFISFNDTNHAEVVQQILNLNTNLLDVKNNKGETPLQLALSMTSLDIVKVLLDHNADVNFLKLHCENKEIFCYPKIVPCFDVVNNILNIIRLIGDRGFECSLEENLSIIKFLAHEVDICECSDDDCNYNKYIQISYLLGCGATNHTKQVLQDLVKNNRIDTYITSLLSWYLNIMNEGNFYLDKEVKEILTDLTNNIPRGTRIHDTLTAIVNPDIQHLKSDVKLKNGIMLYDLMLKHPHTASSFFKQDNFDYKLIEGFKSDFFKNIIKGVITKAIVRNYMVKSTFAFLPLTPLSSLPDICNEIILSYLSNSDIYNLCSTAFFY